LNAFLHVGEENHSQQERGDARRRLVNRKKIVNISRFQYFVAFLSTYRLGSSWR
jgi:hypothetical protein